MRLKPLVRKVTYSAAVCEFSDACEIELVRGFGWETLDDGKSAIVRDSRYRRIVSASLGWNRRTYIQRTVSSDSGDQAVVKFVECSECACLFGT